MNRNAAVLIFIPDLITLPLETLFFANEVLLLLLLLLLSTVSILVAYIH